MEALADYFKVFSWKTRIRLAVLEALPGLAPQCHRCGGGNGSQPSVGFEAPQVARTLPGWLPAVRLQPCLLRGMTKKRLQIHGRQAREVH